MSTPFVQRTHFEICRFSGGKFVGQPIPCATLQEAQTEAAYLARGNLINEWGNREPGLLVFELDDGEEPTGNDPEALYIRRVTTKTEATVVLRIVAGTTRDDGGFREWACITPGPGF